ncbi:hypothetical protein K438DRAFT_1928113 [Mycena galopus ATCC 62051]|nr:hypothetical protein K438DRAFT_1928113 [Mycena galopus ATCC 62051]
MSSLCMKTNEHRQECKETKRKCQTSTHGQRRGPKRPVRQALQRERPASAMWAEMTSTASLEVDGYTAMNVEPSVPVLLPWSVTIPAGEGFNLIHKARLAVRKANGIVKHGTQSMAASAVVNDAHSHLTSLEDREPSKEQKTRTLESGTFTGGTARLTADDLLLLGEEGRRLDGGKRQELLIRVVCLSKSRHKPPHVRGRALMPDGYVFSHQDMLTMFLYHPDL